MHKFLSRTRSVQKQHQDGMRLKEKATEIENMDPTAQAHKYFKRGESYAASTEWRQAMREFEKSLRYDPDFPNANYMLGLSYCRLKRYDDGIEAFRKELKKNPDHPYTLAELGVSLARTGRTRESISYLQRGLAKAPNLRVAHFSLALALLTENRCREAINSFNQALALHGAYADIYRLRGLAYAMIGERDKSSNDLRAAAALDTKDYKAVLSQGVKFGADDDEFQAGQLFELAAKIAPNIALPQFAYGQFLITRRHYEQGLFYIKKAIKLDPLQPRFHDIYGFGLLNQGRIEESVVSYRKAIELEPNNWTLAGGLLFVLQHKFGITEQELLFAHKRWGELLQSETPTERCSFCNNPDPNRNLRIGLVSADLHRHAAAHLNMRAFEEIATLGYEIYCYKTDGKQPDDMFSDRYKAASKSWCDVTEHDDTALAELIAQDKIDILFDLAGHTAGNRLTLFARRAAPIQITWAGYVGTVGLSTFDGLIADPVEVPLGHDKHYLEPIIRMPDCYVCYTPPVDPPDVGPLPFSKNREFTFGCFNRPAKLNAEVGRAWAKILDRVPGSRLILMYGGIGEKSTREAVLKMLASGGLKTDRLTLINERDNAKFLQAYNEVIDLALDPFPYSSGVTTLEAMWMGVPTIALVGKTFAGRHSASHLTAAGLSHLCANSISEYIDLAVDWAHRPYELAALRAGLRERVATCPLTDQVKFAANLDRELRRLWTDWSRMKLSASIETRQEVALIS